MSAAASLYSAIAPDYDRSYAEPGHRQIYDRLAWEAMTALPRPAGADVIDVGCGTGRWSEKLLDLGCTVTGVETAPGMLSALEARRLGPAFTLRREPMERVELPPESADLVLAMGSMQFAPDPASMLHRFARWLRPGGWVCLYVDSLVSLVTELLRRGEEAEAIERLRTRTGIFRHGEEQSRLLLYDRRTLERDLAAAGFEAVECRGLAIGAAAIGRQGSAAAMAVDTEASMRTERMLSADPVLADCGLHLLAFGRRGPAR